MTRELMCPVCGFELGAPAWKGPSALDEICPSCGIHFGYDDFAGGNLAPRPDIYRKWRQRWIADGMRWFSRGRRMPSGWDPDKQLKQLEN